MSVSLALLPVALALRVVMGKEGFEAWVASQQERMETDISSEYELARILKLAGYDAVKYGALVKTHLDGERSFFFWELIDGKWVAVFSKGSDLELRETLISALEAAAGRHVFSKGEAGNVNQSEIYPTNFVDGNLLAQALMELGGDPVHGTDGTISCRINSAKLVFMKQGDGPYIVSIKGAVKVEQAFQYLSDLDDDYRRAVQTSVYQRVKSEAESRDLFIESEEVLPDKSILLTLRFN
jgi:hypothetical protein